MVDKSDSEVSQVSIYLLPKYPLQYLIRFSCRLFRFKMSNFTLNRGEISDGFAARCKDIFGGLLPPPPQPQVTEQNVSNPTTTTSTIKRDSPKRSQPCSDRSTTSKFRGCESIFRENDSEGFAVPCSPHHHQQVQASSSRRTSSTQQPRQRKYTKYSLADVDISDKSNSRAAFDFLREQVQIL